MVILLLFSVFCGWSISVSYLAGYDSGEVAVGTIQSNMIHQSENNLDGLTVVSQPKARIILGMPAWVFWGVALPWIVVDIVAFWFCFRFMKSDSFTVADHQPELTIRETTNYRESGHA